MDKPKFQGNPRNEADLLAFEQALRAWEEAKADAERYDELYKADEPEPGMELQEAIGRFMNDPEFRDRLRGPEGLPGMNGAPGSAGPAGADGAPGADGADGNDWRVEGGAPTLLAGDNEDDLYLNGDNGDIWQVDGGVWDGPLFNIQGPTGATGATGPAGTDGVDGNDWRTGSGAPSIIGGDEEGDMYLDNDDGSIYQVSGGAWVFQQNIRGTHWFDGSGTPSVLVGENGDFYVDTDSASNGHGDIWEKISGTWTKQTNIRGNNWTVGTGAPGAVGAADEAGDMYLDDAGGDIYQVNSAGTLWVLVDNITGPTGATGAAGADGDDATNFTTSHVYINGPGANQSMSGSFIVVDMDTAVVEEPGADWTLSATGELTWENTAAATLVINWVGLYLETGGTNSFDAFVRLEKNGGAVTGTSSVVTVAAGSTLPIPGQAIVTVVENDVLRIRTRISGGSGTGVVRAFGSTLTAVRIA